MGPHFARGFDDGKMSMHIRGIRTKVEWHIRELRPIESFQDKVVREIGCGNGIERPIFATNGASFTGVDPAQVAVDRAGSLC